MGRVRVRCMLIRCSLDALLRLFVCLLKRVANIFQVVAATAAACLDLLCVLCRVGFSCDQTGKMISCGAVTSRRVLRYDIGAVLSDQSELYSKIGLS